MKNKYKCKPRINYSTHFQRDESVGTRDSQNLFEVTPFNRHQGTSPAAPLIPSVSTTKRRAKIINEPAFRFLPLPPSSSNIYIYIFYLEKFREKEKNLKDDDTEIFKDEMIRYREMQATVSKTGCSTQTNFLLSRLSVPGNLAFETASKIFIFPTVPSNSPIRRSLLRVLPLFFSSSSSLPYLSFFLVSSNVRYTQR